MLPCIMRKTEPGAWSDLRRCLKVYKKRLETIHPYKGVDLSQLADCPARVKWPFFKVILVIQEIYPGGI